MWAWDSLRSVSGSIGSWCGGWGGCVEEAGTHRGRRGIALCWCGMRSSDEHAIVIIFVVVIVIVIVIVSSIIHFQNLEARSRTEHQHKAISRLRQGHLPRNRALQRLRPCQEQRTHIARPRLLLLVACWAPLRVHSRARSVQ